MARSHKLGKRPQRRALLLARLEGRRIVFTNDILKFAQARGLFHWSLLRDMWEHEDRSIPGARHVSRQVAKEILARLYARHAAHAERVERRKRAGRYLGKPPMKRADLLAAARMRGDTVPGEGGKL